MTSMTAASGADAHVFRPAVEAFPLDTGRLAPYLAAVGLPLDPDTPVRQFGTGMANINYRLKAGGRMLVLRRPPGGELPPGAHDMAREHRILSRLWRALPLAPESVHLCDDKSVIGVAFQLIDYRPGLVIKGDDKRHFEDRPDVAASTGQMLIDTLAAVHAVDTEAVGLGELGRPDGFIERTRKGWSGRAERLELRRETAMLAREVSDWLARQSVKARSPTLLHSDFKLDNL
ncbi:MAG: phosphotransferase family protein, partial [Hyphomicrobiaceae bacterium]